MARKVPNQMALFDATPEKKKPIKVGTDVAMMLVMFRGAIDVAHWSCPSKEVNDLVESMSKRGYTKIEVLSMTNYWELFHRGHFSTGNPKG